MFDIVTYIILDYCILILILQSVVSVRLKMFMNKDDDDDSSVFRVYIGLLIEVTFYYFEYVSL